MASKLSDNVFCPCKAQEFPPAGKLVVVVCSEESHLGYRDKRGRWRHAVHHQVLEDVMAWCLLSARE